MSETASSRESRLSRQRDLEVRVGQPLPPVRDAVLERRPEAQLIETHGPELPDQVAHDRGDVIDVLDDGRCRTKHGRARLEALLNADGVDLDRIQVLPELVVQLAGQGLPLGLLQVQELSGEAAIVQQQFLEPRFRRSPLRELDARDPVASPCEPCETDGEHRQQRRQLVELPVLEPAGPCEDGFAQFEVSGQQSSEQRRDDDKRHVAPDRRVLQLLLRGCRSHAYMMAPTVPRLPARPPSLRTGKNSRRYREESPCTAPLTL